MSKVETCAICQDVIDISKSVLTSCNHRFHSDCFFKWLKKKPNCPMCRNVFREPNNYEIEQEREILYNLRMTIDEHEELLEEIKGNCFDESVKHTLLLNACTELSAEEELRKIEVLTLQNEINKLNSNYNIILQKRRQELINLEQILLRQRQVVTSRRRMGRMRF